MPVDLRPAMPIARPRAWTPRPFHCRLLWWLATAITAVTAVVAIVAVAAGAVLLGMS
jgi:hypothetical protein